MERLLGYLSKVSLEKLNHEINRDMILSKDKYPPFDLSAVKILRGLFLWLFAYGTTEFIVFLGSSR